MAKALSIPKTQEHLISIIKIIIIITENIFCRRSRKMEFQTNNQPNMAQFKITLY